MSLNDEKPVSNSTDPLQADPAQTREVKSHKHDSPLIACRFDPTGRYVFFGAQDNRIWRWEPDSDAKVELAGHESWVRALAFDTQGQILLTGGYDGRLIWWPAAAENPSPLRTIAAHDGWVRAVAISPDDALVASVGNDQIVKLWSLADGTLVRELAGHQSHIYNVAFHPAGKDLVSGDLKANLIHWDVETGQQVRTFQVAELHKYDAGFRADIGGYRGLEFSEDGKWLAGSGITNVTNAFAGVGNPAAVLLDWETLSEPLLQVSKGNLQGALWNVALHPQGFTVGLSGGPAGTLLFWKYAEKNEFHQVTLPNTARDMDLSPDGLRVVTAHFDGHVRIYAMTPAASP